MENNILELECSEQPISAYQAIGLIDCNISAQGSGSITVVCLEIRFIFKMMHRGQFAQMARLLRPYNRHFENPTKYATTSSNNFHKETNS